MYTSRFKLILLHKGGMLKENVFIFKNIYLFAYCIIHYINKNSKFPEKEQFFDYIFTKFLKENDCKWILSTFRVNSRIKKRETT